MDVAFLSGLFFGTEYKKKNISLLQDKGSFISFQLVPDKITPKFPPPCNQKFTQIQKKMSF